MIYLISYDLKKPKKDYNSLYDTLKKFENCHILDSTWIIKTNKTTSDIFDTLKAVVDNGDHFYIVDITNQKRDGWLPDTVNRCISKIL